MNLKFIWCATAFLLSLLTVTKSTARSVGVTSILIKETSIVLQINTDFYFAPEALKRGRLSRLILEDDPNDFAKKISKQASSCLTKAFRNYRHDNKQIIVDVSVNNVRELTPEEDKTWSIPAHGKVPVCPQTTKASSESSSLRVFVSKSIEKRENKKQRLANYALAQSYKNFELSNAYSEPVYLATYQQKMTRDIRFIPPNLITSIGDGIVLAHEIAHAWGGLDDRYYYQSESNVCHEGYSTNLMCPGSIEKFSCDLTPEQIEVVLQHFQGGPSEGGAEDTTVHVSNYDPAQCTFPDL